MAHPDTAWRSGAIYRCCKRYGMTKDTAHWHLTMNLRRDGETMDSAYFYATRLLEIWDSYKAISEVNPSWRT